jgi:hypothetical protein
VYVETIYCHNGFIASAVPEALAHPLPRLRSLQRVDWPHSGDAQPSINAIESLMVGWRALAAQLPALEEITVVSAKQSLAYDVRHILKLFPRLRAVDWLQEPRLHPNELESWYSYEAIDARKARADAARHITPQVLVCMQASRHSRLDLTSLACIFHFLAAASLMQAAVVCRSWRVAAVSPLVLRPNIRVRVDHVEGKGVIVQGQQLTFSRYESMLAASHSMLFRNIRVLRLSPDAIMAHEWGHGSQHPLPPRYSPVEAAYLRTLELLVHFHSLHSLTLEWLNQHAAMKMTDRDRAALARAFAAVAVRHLRVLCLHMQPQYIVDVLEAAAVHLHATLEVLQLQSTERAECFPFAQALPHLNFFTRLQTLYIFGAAPPGPPGPPPLISRRPHGRGGCGSAGRVSEFPRAGVAPGGRLSHLRTSGQFRRQHCHTAAEGTIHQRGVRWSLRGGGVGSRDSSSRSGSSRACARTCDISSSR